MTFFPAYCQGHCQHWSLTRTLQPHLIEYALQRRRVVCPSISRRPEVPRTHELVNRVSLVLRVNSTKDLAPGIEQAPRLRGPCMWALHELPRTPRTRVHVALYPTLDRRRSTRQERRAVQHAYGNRHIRQPHVVEHQRAGQRRCVHRGAHKDRRVRDIGVDDRFSTDSLVVGGQHT